GGGDFGRGVRGCRGLYSGHRSRPGLDNLCGRCGRDHRTSEPLRRHWKQVLPHLTKYFSRASPQTIGGGDLGRGVRGCRGLYSGHRSRPVGGGDFGRGVRGCRGLYSGHRSRPGLDNLCGRDHRTSEPLRRHWKQVLPHLTKFFSRASPQTS
ncbi:hypothetical protein FRX31_031520, partial [Thalictrum thalictroides]